MDSPHTQTSGRVSHSGIAKLYHICATPVISFIAQTNCFIARGTYMSHCTALNILKNICLPMLSDNTSYELVHLSITLHCLSTECRVRAPFTHTHFLGAFGYQGALKPVFVLRGNAHRSTTTHQVFIALSNIPQN